MKVKILVSLGVIDNGKDYSPAPGSIIELSDATAQNLIDVGYAEAADENTVDDAIPQPDEPGEPAPKPKKKKKADDGNPD